MAGTANVVASDTTGSLAQNKLLMTCQILATGPTGKSMSIRGLLDSGADISAVTSRVAKHLGLKKLNTTVAVSSYGDVINQPAAPTVSLVMDSIHAKPWQATIEAVVIDKITGTIPRSSASSIREHPGLQGVQLADPNFDLPGRVDLLLGIDILPQILKGGVSSGSVGVWQTTLGHAVMGTYEDAPKSIGDRQAAVQVAVQQPESPGHSPDDLALVRFWEVEQPSSKVAPLTQEELSIQNHYISTHSFDVAKGKYQVVLPRNSKGLVLGDSKSRALKRYTNNERALIRKGKYEAVVQEYLDLGHAQLLTSEDLAVPTPSTYYLPMHGVVKEGSSTTKLRVVFYASVPSSTGVSLNDTLGVGPTLHPPLDHILLKFRTYRVALTGDIKSMYREVLLTEADKHLHRFLWRPNEGEPIAEYKMNRLTFGVSASPYLAVRTLQQVASDQGQDLPLVSKHMRESFYVDDLMAGADSVEGALGLFSGLTSVLSRGGFVLRKFRSSHAAVLKGIPLELQEPMPSQDLVDLHSGNYPKALGLAWKSRTDTMSQGRI